MGKQVKIDVLKPKTSKKQNTSDDENNENKNNCSTNKQSMIVKDQEKEQQKEKKKNEKSTTSQNKDEKSVKEKIEKDGRHKQHNTIKYQDDYEIIMPEVYLNQLITKYIENMQRRNIVREISNETELIKKLNSLKETHFNILSSTHPYLSTDSEEFVNSKLVYKVAEFFIHYLLQIEEEQQIQQNEEPQNDLIDLKNLKKTNSKEQEQKKNVLKLQKENQKLKKWNQLLAGTNRNIPTHMMQILLKSNFNSDPIERILALALLHIYAISNETLLYSILSNLSHIFNHHSLPNNNNHGINFDGNNKNNDDNSACDILSTYFVCLKKRIKRDTAKIFFNRDQIKEISSLLPKSTYTCRKQQPHN